MTCLDYITFGHVLAFDNTYKCDEYNKPLIMLAGINRNLKAVTFECALVVHEDDTSFRVLEQLVKAGDGPKSKIVATDGGEAIANVIKVVFLNVSHKLWL